MRWEEEVRDMLCDSRADQANDLKSKLKSWVQIPPGPLLSVRVTTALDQVHF